MSDSLWPHGLQHTRHFCPLLFSRVCSNSCPLNWWHYQTISFSDAPSSFWSQSFPVWALLPTSQSCGKGACMMNEAMRQMKLWDKTGGGPLEEEMATHWGSLAWRTPWTIWKGKKIQLLEGDPPTLPGQKVSNMLLGKSGGQLLIAPGIMKQMGQSRNNAHLLMCLVVKVKFNAVKNNIA